MNKIIFVTSNRDKQKLAKDFFGDTIDFVDIDLDELQEMDADKIAEHKAKQAWNILKKPVVIWDQSVSISCLNGFPGPLIKWFWHTVTLEKICKIGNVLQDNKISTKTILTYFDGTILRHFSGETHGTMPDVPKGVNGFGWDPIFIPEGSLLTNAEMKKDDKNLYQFLKFALNELKTFILTLPLSKNTRR
jgi:non-canonical purine NTP pyrophosphatase (RdgB/HAM1 family)